MGLHEGMTRRRLSARGVKPVQVILPRYEYFWLYGAVEPLTGEALFLEMPNLDAECFQVFLDEFSHTFASTFNLMILDNAPAHVAHRLVIPENVLLVFLPPYSPELNPIERLWEDLRKELGDGLPKDLDDLKERVARVLRDYAPEVLASITGYPYLLHAVAQAA